jgi:hypothetical protein
LEDVQGEHPELLLVAAVAGEFALVAPRLAKPSDV